MSSEELPVALAFPGHAYPTVQLHTQLSTHKFNTLDLFNPADLTMSEVNMENAKMAQATQITPPPTQKLPIADDFETGDEEDKALVAPRASPVIAPLFPTKSASGKLTLPGKFNATFTNSLFGEFIREIYMLDASEYRLSEYLGKGIEVTLHDRMYLDRKEETIQFDELHRRACQFLNLEVPGTELGTEYRCMFNTCREEAWFFAGRLAFEGKLSGVPKQTTLKFLYAKWEEERTRAPSLPKKPASAAASAKKSTPKAAAKKKGKGQPSSTRDILRQRLSAASFAAEEIRPARPVLRESSGCIRRLSPKAAEEKTVQEAEALSQGPPSNSTKAANPKARVRKTRAEKVAEANARSKETRARVPEAGDTIGELSDTQTTDSQASNSSKITIKFRVSPNSSQVSTTAHTPEPTASVEFAESAKPNFRVNSTTPSKKRKGDATDESSPVAKKEAKRTAFDFNHNNEGPPGRFAQAIKAFLNERSNNPADVAAFEDGRELCPADGPDSEHYEDEKKLAIAQKFTDSQYKCQKYRFFLAAAMLTEQNLRIEQYKAAGKRIKTNLLNLNKTQIQLYNNVDVNKSSALFAEFKRFGWIPEMIIQDENRKKIVNPEYHGKFPAKTRKALLDELMTFEATKVNNPERFVVLPSLE